MRNPEGVIEAITGPMFSGKTEELIRRINRVEIAGQRFLLFKPITDTRSGSGRVKSNGGSQKDALDIPTDSPHHLLRKLRRWEAVNGKCDVVGLDEAQFFPHDSRIVFILASLAKEGYRVIVVGLDLDFRGEPFGAMPRVLAIADEISKLTAVCKCGSHHARFSQRMMGGVTAPFEGLSQVDVGGQESYEARCRKCFEFPPVDIEKRAQEVSVVAT